MNLPGTSRWGDVRQLGYLVENVDAAVAAWTRQLGLGPWLVIRNIALQSVWEGKPSVPLIDIGLAYRGDLQIELIQQTNHAPSPYRAFVERRQYGLHHYAFLCEHIDADVRDGQAAGLTLACDINMPGGGRYVYFRSPVPGEQTFIELLEATPTLKAMFAEGVRAAAAWDGTATPVVMDFASMRRGPAQP